MPRKKSTKKKGIVEGVAEGVGGAVEDLGKEIGKITHYFDKISVAVVELLGPLNVGKILRIKGVTTDFKQKAESMQVEHKAVKKAKKGQAVGLKVKEKVRPGDKVYIAEE